MKRLFSLFLALLIFFTGKNSTALAMSPQQEELYQAAIVELNVYKALKLLQKNNIDLNEPIEINGRHTTFLHELLRVATEFHRDQISIDQNISDDSDALLMGSPRYTSQPSVFFPIRQHACSAHRARRTANHCAA